MNITTIYQSSIAKIIPDCAPAEKPLTNLTVWKGERAHFQMAYKPDFTWGKTKVEIVSPLKEFIRVRSVELVPVDFLPDDYDSDAIGVRPGLYPDLLKNLTDDTFSTVRHQWRSLWITLDIPQDLPAGTYTVQVNLHVLPTRNIEEMFFTGQTLTVKVVDKVLPPQNLIVTNWFHTDCIADYYNVEIFSEKHWELIEKFMAAAVNCGINFILTPIVTPPLDTEINTERPTVQLVDISCNNGQWSFNFDKLARWIHTAQKVGIKYFEAAHLFSQWGATATPKIIATVDGEVKHIAGWHVASDSEEYATFLSKFLPALVKWIKENNLQDNFYFHTSDEPHEDHLETYSQCYALISQYLEGMKTCDAMSNLEIFKATGCKTIPVVVEYKFENFDTEELPERWVYYCCNPTMKYPNRFIHMASWRNRILGMLLYKNNIKGFLQWGFNFYYSMLSRYKLNPYMSTTCLGAFPAGDAFIVYPGQDGNIEYSLRAEVFYDGLQDMRCLQQLEAEYGQEKVAEFIKKYISNSGFSLEGAFINYDVFEALRNWDGQ